MKKQPIKKGVVGTKKITKSSTSKDHSKAWMLGGVVVLLAGLGTAYYYYRKRKKEHDQQQGGIPEVMAAPPTMKSTLRPVTSFQPATPNRVKFSCSSTSYPLAYGSCHTDVKTLQKYLKAKGAYLGRSGSSRDGVDGQFGALTQKAAQEQLGKTTFSITDIEGLKNPFKKIKL